MTRNLVLVVEDDAGLREALIDTLSLAGYQWIEATSGEDALLLLKENQISKEDQIDIVISDMQMPGIDGLNLLRSIKSNWPKLPVLLMTAYANIEDAVQAMKEGAIDYMAKPFAPEVLISMVGRYVPIQTSNSEMIVADPKSKELLAWAEKIAQKSDASVMILGPSGSGKEVLARYIHQHSSRVNEPFVAINCAAIPESMLESTLFGYEKGAFTGAVQACPGKFEQAQGGTILLDEISEMPLNLQVKLLRVLQEREVERLGGRKCISLNVRVLATSNRDLEQYVQDGYFREDLYYRLNVFPLKWPALKERPGDIQPLAEYLLIRHCLPQGKEIPHLDPSAIAKLMTHSWPGNVRELDNVIQRALILAEHHSISEDDIFIQGLALTNNSINMTLSTPIDELLYTKVITSSDNRIPEQITSKDKEIEHKETEHKRIELKDTHKTTKEVPSFAIKNEGKLLNQALQHEEFEIILQTLEKYQGNRKEISDALGISPRTLRYKLAKMREIGMNID